MVAYSEHDWDWPGLIKLKADPEEVKSRAPKLQNGEPNQFAINNVLWLVGLRFAREMGYTHVLYLESDCRVGVKHWDEKVFDEYFSIGRPLIAGGNIACYNPCNSTALGSKRWEELVTQNNKRRNVPIPTYGWLPAATKAPSCVFVNGALAIYSIAWMEQLFEHLEDCTRQAYAPSPFDMGLGVKLWDIFQEDSYEVLGHLTSVFSGFGDIMTTEEERLDMVRSGECVGCHQVKSDATV